MTDQTPPPAGSSIPPPPPGYAAPPPPPGYQPAPPGYGQPPMQYAAPMGPGPIGNVRSTGICILLTIVTLGFYTWYWYYQTHEEMKRHTGDGLGGLVAMLLTIFIGIVMPFLTAAEVGTMYERAGRQKPVSGVTGLWYVPGFLLFFIGPIVWFVKTNGAINEYWKSLGATA